MVFSRSRPAALRVGRLALLALCFAPLVRAASAQGAPGYPPLPITASLPANAYIRMGALEWAWAMPLPGPDTEPLQYGGFSLAYQSQFGWRLPTAAELVIAPLATDFMFAGANVPLGGRDPLTGAFFDMALPTLQEDAACATPYFNAYYRHCDWISGRGQGGEDWAGTPGAPNYAEQLVVREAPASPSTTAPEPLSGALLATGLLALQALRRRHRAG